jgi:hypothetical protein
MLYFGEEMERSLLNQNQIRHHIRRNEGYISDDFTREDETLGMLTGSDEVFIPFQMDGTALNFASRVPSEDELENLPHIVITADEAWDPKNVRLRKVSSASKPQDRRVRDYETDVHLGSISTTLLEKTSGERMISSIRISDRTTGAVISNDRHSKITAENLSRIWGVGLDTAHKTLKVTTQMGVRTALHPITRRYRVDHLHLHRNRLDSAFYTDTLFSKVQSLSGNKCAQVFTNGEYTALYPAVSKSSAGIALGHFTDDVGIPDSLTADQAGETTGKHTEFIKKVYDLRIKMHWAERGRKNQNHKAEREIGILKERWQRRMTRKRVHNRVWDYGLVYESEIMCRLSRGYDGRTGYEKLTGNTPDISEWLDFEFYDLVWYHADPRETDKASRQLGKWLGISHRVGSDMCYWILTAGGKVLSNTSVQHVIRDEHRDPAIKSQIEQFENRLDERLNDTNFTSEDPRDGTPYIQDIKLPSDPMQRGVRGHDSRRKIGCGRTR